MVVQNVLLYVLYHSTLYYVLYLCTVIVIMVLSLTESSPQQRGPNLAGLAQEVKIVMLIAPGSNNTCDIILLYPQGAPRPSNILPY